MYGKANPVHVHAFIWRSDFTRREITAKEISVIQFYTSIGCPHHISNFTFLMSPKVVENIQIAMGLNKRAVDTFNLDEFKLVLCRRCST
jgi:hypothetical protein